MEVRTAIKIFELSFPGRKGIWIFDNSSAHDSKAKDSLSVTKMNVKPGGAQPHMHDTIIPTNNPHGRGGQRQSFQFPSSLPNNHPYKPFEGQPKGMRVILEERKLIGSKMKIIGICKRCQEVKSRKPQVTGLSPSELAAIDNEEGNDTEEEEDDRPTDCCMTRMLSLQEDFKNEPCLLEQVSKPMHCTPLSYFINSCNTKVITEAGHICLFLPKFHPELNPIEMYWGWVKRYFRERANGNFKTAQKLFSEALDACPLTIIRRFFRRAYRYMSVYRQGATGLLAEFAVKQYKSHRGITLNDLAAAESKKKEVDAKEAAIAKKRALA